MGARESMSVPGTLAGIRQAAQAFEAWGGRQGMPVRVTRSLLTALDEVLANIVHHGFGGREGVIDVVFSCQGGTAAIEVADAADPFNPLLVSAPDTTAPLEDRAIGGLGIALVKALVDDVRYERRNGRNCLTLTRRLEDEGPQFKT